MDLLDRVQKVSGSSARLIKYHSDLVSTGPHAGKYQTQGYFLINEKTVEKGPLVLALTVQGFTEYTHPLSLAHVPLLFSEFNLRILQHMDTGAFAYLTLNREGSGWTAKENFLGFSKKGADYGIPVKTSPQDWTYFQHKQHPTLNDVGLPHLPKLKLSFSSPLEAISAFHMLYAYTK